MAKLIARIEDGHVVVDRDVPKVSPLVQYYIDDSYCEDDYCHACNGTGENQFDVGRCGDCKGTGFFNSTKG